MNLGRMTAIATTALMMAAPAQAEDGRMIYGETTRLDSFDPYTTHELAAYRLSDLLFDGLVAFTPSGDYRPGLAESWEIRKGNAAVAFKLRPGVSWHDGTTAEPRLVSARDVVATLKALVNAKSEIPNRERFEILAGAEALGDGQVVISLKRAVVDPLRHLTFKILPAHHLSAADGFTRDSFLTKNPVGTGPYRFEKASAQGEVLVAANEGYFGGKPIIPSIVLKTYSDQSVMAQSLMFNSLDLITYVSPRDLDEITADKRLRVVPYDALSYSFFAHNTARPVLKDRNVRKAIGYAIDREEMLNSFFGGKGELISGPFPPTSWAYNIDVANIRHDKAKAMELLAMAGYEDRDANGFVEDKAGKELRLGLSVPVGGESETIKRIVLAFQSYLADVGIAVELQFLDWLVWKDRVLGRHDFDMTIATWSFDDDSNITSLFHSAGFRPWGNNFVAYRNPEADALLTEAELSSDYDRKRLIYHKLHVLLADEAPYTFLWTLKHHAAHGQHLKGVNAQPFAFFDGIQKWRVAPDATPPGKTSAGARGKVKGL